MSEPLTPTIETEVQVMFFDTDCAAVVHNIAYLRFIEIARTLLAEQLGMGLVAMAETHLFPVVMRTEIDYRKPARLGDKLIVHGRLEAVERMRFWCAFDDPAAGGWHAHRAIATDARADADASRKARSPACGVGRTLRAPAPPVTFQRQRFLRRRAGIPRRARSIPLEQAGRMF